MSKEKAIIIFTVAIDVIGLGIIIPVLPVYVESFGLSAFSVTLMLSVFSLFSFLSAPFLGALSDKIGRKPVLLISIASTSLGWFIFALAKSLPFLMLGRIIDGMAAGNFSTAQSAIADVSKDDKERAGNLGIIGMIFGLGFIIGPFIGGLLSKVSHSFPFFFVGGMALLNVVLAYFFLPETNKHIDSQKEISWNPLAPIISAVKNGHLRSLFAVWFLFCLAAVAGNSVFALYLQQMFGLTPFITGLFFTGIGVVLALNQGLLIKKLWLKKFKQKQLILIMLLFFVAGFLMMSIPSIPFFILGMILTALGQSTLNVTMANEIVGQAGLKERGSTVGVMSAVSSLATILAPLMSGFMFERRPYYSYIMVAVFSAIAWILMKRIKIQEGRVKEISDLLSEVTV